MCIKGKSAWSDVVPKKPYRLSMEDFNRICIDCGLTPNEEKNAIRFGEASYFYIKHPISDKPIEIACYEEIPDDDHCDIIHYYISVDVPRQQLNLALSGYRFEVISTSSPYGLTEEKVRRSIANLKQFLDEEYEARKQKVVPLNKFIDYFYKTYACWRNVSVELSCPFNEFMEKVVNASVHINVGDVSVTFKQEESK